MQYLKICRFLQTGIHRLLNITVLNIIGRTSPKQECEILPVLVPNDKISDPCDPNLESVPAGDGSHFH